MGNGRSELVEMWAIDRPSGLVTQEQRRLPKSSGIRNRDPGHFRSGDQMHEPLGRAPSVRNRTTKRESDAPSRRLFVEMDVADLQQDLDTDLPSGETGLIDDRQLVTSLNLAKFLGHLKGDAG